MDENASVTERFEEHRHRLRAVAYRMLGSLSEADDAVQEAWLRLHRADTSGVENPTAWLTGPGTPRRPGPRHPRRRIWCGAGRCYTVNW